MRGRRAGFTLLEVLVALGVLAIGATAAFSLLVAAASAGRRAEHQVHAALIADTVLSDLKGDTSLDLDLSSYPRASAVLAERHARAPRGTPPPPEPTEDAVLARTTPCGTSTPTTATTWRHAAQRGPVPDQPWEFLVEVDVRWSDQGQRRARRSPPSSSATSPVDNPRPRATRGSERRAPGPRRPVACGSCLPLRQGSGSTTPWPLIRRREHSPASGLNQTKDSPRRTRRTRRTTLGGRPPATLLRALRVLRGSSLRGAERGLA
ncbi:MAG: prepilin-type N-terminal cleavage/methylation domain-containing protein [Planctomycetota bacterium]|nr:prepilin-type N-terminal cleavage/methylation domain-containing protein [Planctomycetota bacterium]